MLTLVRQHLMNSEIAARLFVSERTVESHVSALMRKLGAANRRELAALAVSDHMPALPAALELAAEARPLLGRDAELSRLLDLWHQAMVGTRRAAVVLGEAGIGKTRLVAELAAVASGDGATVVLASCREDDVAPYRPLADAVAADLRSLPPDEAARRTAGLPALDALLAGRRPVAGPGDASWEQQAAHQAVDAYLSRTAASGPVLLVVDDLHWAAPSTARAVAALLRPAPAAPILVVATCRDTAPDLEGGTRALLAGALRSPGVTRIDLSGLDAVAIAELAGAAPADGLWAETRGNPLFALELLAVPSGGTGPTLASLVDTRAARLGELDQHLLDLAAVSGAEFDVRLLAAAAGCDAATAVEAMERIESAGLVWPLPGSSGRWAFVHPVFRQVRYDGLGGGRRPALHDALATALGEEPSLGAGSADLARHAYAACPLGDLQRTVAACRAAGEQAAAVHAVDEAVAHFRAALDVATGGAGDESVRCELAIRVGALLHTTGRAEGATALSAAAGVARRLGDGRLLGEIAWALSHFGSGLMGMPSDLITGLVDDALDLVEPADVAVRARLLGLRASQLAFAGDTARARSVSDYALGLARSLDDPAVVGEVLLTRRLAIFTPATLELRLQTVAEMAALGDGHGWRTLAVLGRLGLASFRREQGDLVASSRALDEATELMDGTPPAWVTLLASAMAANRRLLAGDLAGSERLVQDLRDLPVTAGAGLSAVVDPATWAEPHLLAIRHCQGRLAELRNEVGRYASFGGAAAPVQACALAYAGQVDEARADLDRWTADAFRSLPEDVTWLTAMVMLAEAAAVTGHVDAAVALGTLLGPYAGRLDNYGDGSLSSVDLALAQLALVAPAGKGAEELSAAAVASCRRAGTPILLGRALVCLATALDAKAPREEALALADRTGALLIEQDAARYGLL